METLTVINPTVSNVGKGEGNDETFRRYKVSSSKKKGVSFEK